MPFGLLLASLFLVLAYLVARWLAGKAGWQFVLLGEDVRLREYLEKTGRLGWLPWKRQRADKKAQEEEFWLTSPDRAQKKAVRRARPPEKG